jgi:hypothetical protein
MAKKKRTFDKRKDKAYTVEEVFDFVNTHIVVDNYPRYQNNKEYRKRYEFDGDMMKPWSLRYFTFMLKGCVCCQCKTEGTVFYKEHNNPDDAYHFNLYGINSDGEEVLFTKDHKNPKSKGGSNKLSNFVTMCQPCNSLKDNMTLDEWNDFKRLNL